MCNIVLAFGYAVYSFSSCVSPPKAFSPLQSPKVYYGVRARSYDIIRHKQETHWLEAVSYLASIHIPIFSVL